MPTLSLSLLKWQDTAEYLNTEERRQTLHSVNAGHRHHLDTILELIHEVETEETQMMVNGRLLATNGTVAAARNAAASSSSSSSHLVLPLEVVRNVELPTSSSSVLLPEEISQGLHHEERQRAQKWLNPNLLASLESLPPFDQPNAALRNVALPFKTSVLTCEQLQSIEKKRLRFLKHRRLAEASLTDTRLDQCSVIEM